MLHRRDVRDGQGWRGRDWATKRGKGMKIMAIVDRHGLPLSVSTHAANHHEVRLVQLCFDFYMIEAKPENLIGDRAYDSDPLDEELRRDGIEMIAPHRANRSKPPARLRGRSRRTRSKGRCRWSDFSASRHATTAALPPFALACTKRVTMKAGMLRSNTAGRRARSNGHRRSWPILWCAK